MNSYICICPHDCHQGQNLDHSEHSWRLLLAPSHQLYFIFTKFNSPLKKNKPKKRKEQMVLLQTTRWFCKLHRQYLNVSFHFQVLCTRAGRHCARTVNTLLYKRSALPQPAGIPWLHIPGPGHRLKSSHWNVLLILIADGTKGTAFLLNKMQGYFLLAARYSFD